LGSVLLLLAWKLPEAELAAVEAQQISFELLRRNVARSGFAERLHIAHGDLRDRALMATLSGPFELITGTPPYFAPSDALPAEDEQREYARIEHRGGVEAYIAAGAELLEPHGALVLCADARSLHRTTSACDEAGLHLRARTDIVARQGKPALFSVFTLRRDAGDCAESTLTLRGAAGEPTSDAAALREFSGMERK
jgi:tRNA1(Val) A37 N6-methylase TrmN6